MTAQVRNGATARPIVRGPGDGIEVDAPAGRVTYKARGTETGGAMSVFQTVAAPGEGPPVHVHASDDEFIYVVEGRLHVLLVETTHDAPAGSFLFIPKGLPHTWQSVGDGDARFLFGFAPASPGMEHFFERAEELAATTRLAEAFARFAADAGMQVLGDGAPGIAS
jgi:quercetin dioxygenase-like cupin family protein